MIESRARSISIPFVTAGDMILVCPAIQLHAQLGWRETLSQAFGLLVRLTSFLKPLAGGLEIVVRSKGDKILIEAR